MHTQSTLVLPKPHYVSRPSAAIRSYQVLDAAIALTVLFGVLTATNLQRMPNGIQEFLALRITVKNLVLLGGISIVWFQICAYFGLYEAQRPASFRDELIRVVKVCTVGSAFALVFPLTSVSGYFSMRALLYFWLGTTAATAVARYSAYKLIGYSTSRRSKIKHALIVGSGPRAYRLYQEISAMPEGTYSLLGFVDSSQDVAFEEVRSRMLGSLDQLEEILVSHIVDEVFIALPIKSCYNDIQAAIRVCEEVGVESKYLSDVFQVSLAKPRYEQTQQFPMVTMKVVQDDYRLIVKRAIDIVGSACGLIVCLPILASAVLAIKLTSRGPAFFTQERFGLNKRRFKMIKFRSMVTDAEALQASLEEMNEARGPVFKIKNDPRLTPVGKFIRKTSVDELPQLLNVLLGDMSLVGPRPLPKRDVALFSEAALMRRFSVKPGITCLWQISGRSNVGFDRWAELDLKYIDGWSLSSDMKILVKTIPAVLKCNGAV